MCQFFQFSLENSYCSFWMCTDKNTGLTHRLKPVSVLAVQFSVGHLLLPLTLQAACDMHVLCMVYTGLKTCMLNSWQPAYKMQVSWSVDMQHACYRLHACCIHGYLHVICMFRGHWTCNVHTVCYMHVVCYTPNARCVLCSQCMLHACSIWVAHPDGYLVLSSLQL